MGRSPSRSLAVCVQDIHSPFTTIHEALQFSAGLRLSATVGAEQKQAFVEVRA